MTRRVLVAGIGNIFLSDDGFGVEVATRLAARTLPDGVRVEDFGIRGVHLAYELLDGYDALVLIDAVPMGEPPGTLAVIEPEPDMGDTSEADRGRARRGRPHHEPRGGAGHLASTRRVRREDPHRRLSTG